MSNTAPQATFSSPPAWLAAVQAVVLAFAVVSFAEEPEPAPAEPTGEGQPLETFFGLYQPYLGNIAAYKPMYFLVGTDPKDSAFQLSFKYEFYTPHGTSGRRPRWLPGLHFGYTQTSFWDLRSDSKPFEGTSYKPEFFLLSQNIRNRPKWADGLFIQAGFEHESNGRGDDGSRGTNHLYVRPIFILFDPDSKLGLEISPKIWAYVDNSDSNPDLARYRGYFELELKAGQADSYVLGSTFRWGENGASVQLDLTYPIHRYIFRNTHLYLQVQYLNALAEHLIDYRERNEVVRIGFAIVR